MKFSLEVKTRTPDKDSQLTDIRANAQVPGIIYGLGQEPQSIVMEYGPLLKILTQAGTSNIISLKLADKEIRVIVREFQQDPVTDKITHVDFWAVDDKTVITTKVPLEFIGISKAVKEQGAKLEIKNDIIKVKCLPKDLPASLILDLSVLAEVGQTILIKDIKAIEGVRILNNGNDPVMSVIIPRKLQVIQETEEKVAEGAEGEAAEGEDVKEGEASKDGETKEGEPDKPAEK